jgi:hypothetical protein
MRLLFKQNPWIAICLAQSIMGLHLIGLYNQQVERYKKCYDIALYFSGLLEKHNIELDEFDRIILQSIVGEGEETSATKSR